MPEIVQMVVLNEPSLSFTMIIANVLNKQKARKVNLCAWRPNSRSLHQRPPSSKDLLRLPYF